MALTDQKLSVLKAIGNMSRNTVSGAGTLQNLSTTVAELFITMLSSEGNDLEEIIPKMSCLVHMSSLAKSLSKIVIDWERSGSVVECLTRDRGAAGSTLTGVTALWSLSKTHLS